MKTRHQHLPSDPQSLRSSLRSLLILALRLENQTFRWKVKIRSNILLNICMPTLKCLFMRKKAFVNWNLKSELPLWCLVEGLSPQTAFLWSAGQDKAHGWTLNGQKSEGEMLQCQYNSSQMALSRQWEIEVTESESPFSNLSLWFGVKAVLLRGEVPRRVVSICWWIVWAVVCKLLCSSTSGWKEVNGEG